MLVLAPRHYRFVSSDYSNCFSLGTNVMLCRRLLQIGELTETSVDRGCWMLLSKKVNENQNTQLDKCIEFEALAKQCGTSSLCSDAVINLCGQIVLTKNSARREGTPVLPAQMSTGTQLFSQYMHQRSTLLSLCEDGTIFTFLFSSRKLFCG